MLTVHPKGKINFEILESMFSFSSTHCIVIGKVQAEELVPKAVTRARNKPNMRQR